jgi:hypothetical protein
VHVPAFLHSHARWSTCFVLPSPPPPLFCPSLILFVLIPVFREICVFWKCVWKCPQDGECGSRVCKNTPQAPPPPHQNHPFNPPAHSRLYHEIYRRTMAEFRPHGHALEHETSPGRPQCDSHGRVAYFDASRGVPAYSQCPRSTEDSRCVPRHLQCPCALMFSYFHILRPQNVRKKRCVSPNLGPKAFLQMIV